MLSLESSKLFYIRSHQQMQISRLILFANFLPFRFDLAVPLSQEAKHRLFGGALLGLGPLRDGRSGRKAMQRGQIAVELYWSTLLDYYLICGRDGHCQSISFSLSFTPSIALILFQNRFFSNLQTCKGSLCVFQPRGIIQMEGKEMMGMGDEDFGACRILRQKIKKDRLIKCQPNGQHQLGKEKQLLPLPTNPLFFEPSVYRLWILMIAQLIWDDVITSSVIVVRRRRLPSSQHQPGDDVEGQQHSSAKQEVGLLLPAYSPTAAEAGLLGKGFGILNKVKRTRTDSRVETLQEEVESEWIVFSFSSEQSRLFCVLLVWQKASLGPERIFLPVVERNDE